MSAHAEAEVSFPPFRRFRLSRLLLNLPSRRAMFRLSGATGFDGFDEGIAACPGPDPW